jgi:hypothetical protein
VAARKPHRKSGLVIDVARVISVGCDRDRGGALLRFRAGRGRIVAVRLRPQQFRTLTKRGAEAGGGAGGAGLTAGATATCSARGFRCVSARSRR